MGKADDEDTSSELVSALRDFQIELRILGGTKGALIRAPRPHWLTATKGEAAPADEPVKRVKPRCGHKFLAVQRVLGELYPPDGKTEDPANIVRPKVVAKLGYDVSRSTVNRALGRE